MLKMVIADDKPSTREGLRRIVAWEEEGIQVVGVTADGRETMEACAREEPDILLTDIRMPHLSGLEVARALRERGLGTRTIIVSGIADFELARDAVDLHAAGYLLKPVKIEELRSVVRRVVVAIKAERRQRQDLVDLRRRYRESLSVLRASYLRDLLAGYEPSPLSATQTAEDVARELESLEWRVDARAPITVGVAQIDDYGSVQSRTPATERHILQLGLERLLAQFFSESRTEVTRTRENEVSIVSSDDPLPGIQAVQRECEELLGVSFSVGVGRPAATVLQVARAYREAELAIQHRFYTGNNAVIEYDSLYRQAEPPDTQAIESLCDAAIRAIEVGEADEVDRLLRALFEVYAHRAEEALPDAQGQAAHLLVRANQSLRRSGKEAMDLAASIGTVLAAQSIYDLNRYLSEELTAASAAMRTKYTDQTSELVDKVKRLVEERYAENIGMPDIAEAVHYSPNYLSLVFRRITGRTTKEYLTEVRIEHAKHLLRTTDKMVFEIAPACGFQNAHYFSTVFRKTTGYTAREYRESTR